MPPFKPTAPLLHRLDDFGERPIPTDGDATELKKAATPKVADEPEFGMGITAEPWVGAVVDDVAAGEVNLGVAAAAAVAALVGGRRRGRRVARSIRRLYDKVVDIGITLAAMLPVEEDVEIAVVLIVVVEIAVEVVEEVVVRGGCCRGCWQFSRQYWWSLMT
ncbi:hypothetical protein BC830DRAFT_1114820 [Chytriomyces sp. MP71]|nr:hypothetical protein BC830DRAFT_1114820 [Chytriomyces sp. MP71]